MNNTMLLDFGDGYMPPANPINLSEKFSENPFSVLDGKSGRWQACDREYKEMNIDGGEGRDVKVFDSQKSFGFKTSDTSIFSPRLTHLMYQWFCPCNGRVLDPFAGGSTRGVIAGINGLDYTGIDIREEQIEADNRQVEKLKDSLLHTPKYICGDSRTALDAIGGGYDMILSCPPYFDLEVYSDLPGDISNMLYGDFLDAYRDIIRKSAEKLKKGCFAVWVIGEVRDGRGMLRGLVPDTIKAFQDAGMDFYNDMILLNNIGTAGMRWKQFQATRKVVRVHQYVLVFCKGKPNMERFSD